MGRNAKLRQQRKQPGSKPNVVRFLHSQPDSLITSQEESPEVEKSSSFLGKLFDRFKPGKKSESTSAYVPSTDSIQFFDRYHVLVCALAWQGHEKSGRGLLRVKDGLESFEAEYIPISKLRSALRELALEANTLTVIANMVKDYDPQTDIVLLFQSQDENHELTAYLPNGLDPSPPESYRLYQQKMAAVDRPSASPMEADD